MFFPWASRAQSSRDSSTIRFSGFVDTYFAFDFNRPPRGDRAFTTQAARHSEMNVNLAFVDATLSHERVRGRLAIQFGTSVQTNYAAEPTLGAVSGPEVSRFLQEAFVGYRVAPKAWIDAGIMLAPFGAENWVSRDNYTYTRSYIADNSPYYEAGVRGTWQATPTVEVQLHVINGWQNISETNEDKAIATRLLWNPSPHLTLVYDNFVGNEVPDSLPARLRVFQEAVARVDLGSAVNVAVAYDWGTEQRTTGGHATWNGYSAIARYRVTPRVSLAGRVERYADAEQIIVPTRRIAGLQTTGASLNFDAQLEPRLVLRTEIRLLEDDNAVFPSRIDPGGFVRRNLAAIVSVAATW